MAQRDNPNLFLCILFITCYCTVTLAQVGLPMDCCLEVGQKEIDKAAFANYHRQIRGQGCEIEAVIFVTRRGKKLCMPADSQWVREVMSHVDTVRDRCKKRDYKPKSCFGVKP